MHEFDELAWRGTEFTLAALNEAQKNVLTALQTIAATDLVKSLQMVQLQKAILAVGMVSMFDAQLSDAFECADGLGEAIRRLTAAGHRRLSEALNDLKLAINVLKHGRGRSYELLVKRAGRLPFRVKLPEDPFFNEGDVSEVSTLIEVDDSFIRHCAAVVREVSAALR